MSITRVGLQEMAEFIEDQGTLYMEDIELLPGQMQVVFVYLQEAGLLEQIHSVEFSCSAIYDSLNWLAGFPNLKQLKMDSSWTTRGWSFLSRLTNITYLSISDCGRISEVPQHLKPLTNLSKLRLAGGQLNQCLAPLSALKLRRLSLHNCAIRDDDLTCLRSSVELEMLRLRCNNIWGYGLQYLAGLPELYQLYLKRNELTDEFMRHLPNVPNLRELQISYNPISDLGLEHLEKMDKLRVLQIGRNQITSHGVARLKQSLPNLFVHDVRT